MLFKVKAEEAFAETARERKLREKAEAQLLGRASTDAVDQGSASGGSGENSEELQALRSQLEKLELEHTEALLAAQQRASADALAVQQRLDEAEAERVRMEKELAAAKERLERAKKDNLQVKYKK